MFEFIATPALYLSVALLGLVLGSFINVIIYRLPVMLEFDSTVDSKKPIDLIQPRSFCPSCKTQLSLFENIPLLSFIFLAGKCRHCSQTISIQYPIIELLSALIACIAIKQFGANIDGLFALVFLLSLLTLSVIDIHTMTLPDEITLSLLWLGIAFNLFTSFVSLEESVIGAMLGYTSLWMIFQLHRLITNREGMGYGDFKLFAMIGACLGWSLLLPTILIASISASVIGVTLLFMGKLKKESAIPFGPFLAIGASICLIWHNQINNYFFNY
jgi:leader peptidase (prepilin peptidase)/N-methyltransferase|tara:strand:+ start:1138 stop:1953 length:816 start_codon:yes stop_codon:yes gene_type:complete